MHALRKLTEVTDCTSTKYKVATNFHTRDNTYILNNNCYESKIMMKGYNILADYCGS